MRNTEGSGQFLLPAPCLFIHLCIAYLSIYQFIYLTSLNPLHSQFNRIHLFPQMTREENERKIIVESVFFILG